MRTRYRLALLAIAVAVAVVAAVLIVGLPGEERTTVTFSSDDGTELAVVDVAVSDSLYERYTGLSETESLDRDEGMLFVHPVAGEHAYVMRDMAFPIDIVFVAENGTITTIHHAELPEGDDLTEYRGHGKYVVELPYNYTTDHDISVGDSVHIPKGYRKADG